jgi:methionyl-tRNA formyltransferase
MKNKILLCFYRDWGAQISDKVIAALSDQYEFYTARHTAELKALNFSVDFDLIFFIGWSWIVEKEILDSALCICMHPSRLPRYKGGSPLQNQIINGEKESAVTFFKMTEKTDTGPIILSNPFSLEGNLNEIFERIKDSCLHCIPIIISRFFKTNLHLVEQNLNEATYFKRRTPDQSEIKIEDFAQFPSSYFYNKIRMLQDPYPNAYIKCKGNTKLFITNSYGSDYIPSC